MFRADQRQKSVFDREDALSTTKHTDPIGRENKLERIADAVRPLTTNQEPEDLLIYGPAGSGKTTCVKHVLDKLEQETSITPVIINCWNYNTRSAILTQLLIELGYPAPRKGKPVDALLGRLREWLDKHGNVVVALDEFDQLDDQNEIVYDLHSLSVETDAHMGQLLIANKPPSQIKLEPRSNSRLGYHTIQFLPYEEDDLEHILRELAEQAFRPNAITDTAIEAVATAVEEDKKTSTGDCRHALEILHRAGREADKEHADKVTAAHVERAINPARL